MKKRVFKFLYYFLPNLINKAIFKTYAVNYGFHLESRGRIYIKNKGNIEIGDYFRVNSSMRSNPIGVGSKTMFQVLRNARLVIKDNVGMSNTAITCSDEIVIGNNVRFGSGCRIYDTDFHSINPIERTSTPQDPEKVRTKRINIEDYVFVGAGSFILKGSNIGKYAVIGAGSVVSGRIPEKQIWAGNPARYIRDLTEEELYGT